MFIALILDFAKYSKLYRLRFVGLAVLQPQALRRSKGITLISIRWSFEERMDAPIRSKTGKTVLVMLLLDASYTSIVKYFIPSVSVSSLIDL